MSVSMNDLLSCCRGTSGDAAVACPRFCRECCVVLWDVASLVLVARVWLFVRILID